MSHFCKNIKCPNRRTIGKENDDDVISIVCSKCERLLFISELRKDIQKRHKKRALLVVGILLVLFPIYYYKETIFSTPNNIINAPTTNSANENNNQTNKNDSSVTTKEKDKYKETIKAFISAENRRDFDEIKTYFSDFIVRYWNSEYLNKQKLKQLYYNSWKNSSYGKNVVKKITKINSKSYLLLTQYTYYHIKTAEEKTIISKVKFIFNDNGKIIQTYGVN